MARNVLILGAGSDIARAIARECAGQSDTLILAARDAKRRLADDAKDLELRGAASVELAELDILALDALPAFAQRHACDIAICAIGLLGDQAGAQGDAALAQKIIASNYTGPALLLGLIAQRMQGRGQGLIVGISSVAGDRGRASNYVYGSAKAGFSAFLSGLRNRLARSGVRVITIKPGFVDTAMTAGMDLPGALTAQPEEVARTVQRAIDGRRDVVYVRAIWRLIMLIIRAIPEFIFKRLPL